MKTELLNRLMQDQKAKQPVALATNLTSGGQALIYPDTTEGALADDPDISDAARNALRKNKSVTIEAGDDEVFIQVFNPALRMIIVGAVHISQHLARMADLTGYDVTIIDPRGAFASEERFREFEILDDWPDDAMRQLAPDKRTAVITLTHDPKLDDPALEVALKSDAFYIGCLGSRKTHGARLERLRRAGFEDDALAHIHGPVGLDIGAVSPSEIAVSIMGEVTSVLRKEVNA